MMCPPAEKLFLSTLSLRRATDCNAHGNTSFIHFYPRSPCGERLRCPLPWSFQSSYFYPRSPCGERLFCCRCAAGLFRYFYPRSPCGERPIAPICLTALPEFLSTLSLRRATLGGMSDKLIDSVFLSTLSLRRATS